MTQQGRPLPSRVLAQGGRRRAPGVLPDAVGGRQAEPAGARGGGRPRERARLRRGPGAGGPGSAGGVGGLGGGRGASRAPEAGQGCGSPSFTLPPTPTPTPRAAGAGTAPGLRCLACDSAPPRRRGARARAVRWGARLPRAGGRPGGGARGLCGREIPCCSAASLTPRPPFPTEKPRGRGRGLKGFPRAFGASLGADDGGGDPRWGAAGA